MSKRKLQRLLVFTALLVTIFLLTACTDAEQIGREVGQTLHDFWVGFVEGCSGNAFLPMIAGVIGWFCVSRARRE